MAGLDDILNPRGEEQQEEVAEETQEETAAEETGAEETQVAAEAQETQQQQEEDPVAALKAQVAAELEAAKAEKAALGKERERIRQKEQALEAQRQQPAQEEEKKGFWDDPEGTLTAVEQRLEQRMQIERLNISEMYAREKHTDYQEKLDAFADMVRENPALYHQMVQQVNPAEFVYTTAANALKLKEMGDPQEYERKLRENIEAELRAKIAAEQEEQKAAQVEEAIKQKLPKAGFSEKRSVGGVKNPPYSGPRPLGDILKG